ncbi:hypothetical protein RRF57_005519 [Xylaria bambusicola]|uniref:Uncharacterized protein n=1 Tax=Xylaria bambusicola TaxID=326684 RepID=A0AAN7UQE2_9PEZI
MQAERVLQRIRPTPDTNSLPVTVIPAPPRRGAGLGRLLEEEEKIGSAPALSEPSNQGTEDSNIRSHISVSRPSTRRTGSYNGVTQNTRPPLLNISDRSNTPPHDFTNARHSGSSSDVVDGDRRNAGLVGRRPADMV